jgi:hypothetical protein
LLKAGTGGYYKKSDNGHHWKKEIIAVGINFELIKYG